MLNSANSMPRHRNGAPQPIAHAGDPISSGHGFSRAVQTRPQEPSPFVYPDAGRARLSNSRRLRRASANYSHSALSFERRTGIMSTNSAKLDFPPNPTKSTTSKFLIDNFCTVSAFRFSPASSFELPASRNSNRHIPLLESVLSHRKQRIALLSNRHKFAFCDFHFLRTSSARPERIKKAHSDRRLRFRLSTLDCLP